MGKIEREETMGKAHILHNGSQHQRGGIAGEAGVGAPLGLRASKASKSAVGGGCGVF
jgi:hypothetical protein